ncbi:MAG: hypothetical protein WCH39_27675, partial [Schlesneria sp.]
VESCAIALAMAGGRPEYLPVLIAAVEAFFEPSATAELLQATSGSPFPVDSFCLLYRVVVVDMQKRIDGRITTADCLQARSSDVNAAELFRVQLPDQFRECQCRQGNAPHGRVGQVFEVPPSFGRVILKKR